MNQFFLSTNWQLKQRNPAGSIPDDFTGPDGWLPASVPGTVHQDLLAAGRIPDPFFGLNELDVQWVGECDWLYGCTFNLPSDFLAVEAIALCFDGLDTHATIWLNDEKILISDNMFLPQRVRVESLLRAGSNELRILFESALRRGKELESKFGVAQAWNGDPSRVYVRKAQYHYGWDWGPCLITAGPWRPIRLEAYDVRIADFHGPAEIAPDLSRATIPVSVTLESGQGLPESRAGLGLLLRLYGPANEPVGEVTLPVTGPVLNRTFEINSPALWWPRGYGDQPLYRIEATLQADGEVFDWLETRLGLRRLQLLQDPLEHEPGTTFLFEVNNTPIFCGGANWIPADSFTPRVPPEHYRTLLQLAADANMVMLRVWGGGIYEEGPFYDLCDELGLLVWQDFMFACGLYPAFDQFQESVRAEAEASVRRLRHHPCIALWCGNNEDYMLAATQGIYDPAFVGDFLSTPFPARSIYERLLPELCSALDPTRLYRPGSPYGGSDPNDSALGDRHTWDIWHGIAAKYQDYPRFAGRFVSEFGMQALPELATIEAFTGPEERYPESRTLDHHNKASDGTRRIAMYLNDNVRTPDNLQSYIYATQLVQAEALAAAYRGWRRRWRGPGRYGVAGALVWQLDDCWPVTSWAIVDYALRPKAAYYVVRRELAPLVVGLERTAAGAEAWAVNGSLAVIEAVLELQAWTLDGKLVSLERHQAIPLPANGATELGGFRVDEGSSLVLSARLLVNGVVKARAAMWPEPFKYFQFPEPEIELTRQGKDELGLLAGRPAKGVLLSAESRISWSDNMLDLIPGDEQIVLAPGLGDAEVKLQWLGRHPQR